MFGVKDHLIGRRKNWIDSNVEWIEIDNDEFGGIFGSNCGFSDYHGDGFANKAHYAGG